MWNFYFFGQQCRGMHFKDMQISQHETEEDLSLKVLDDSE